MLLESNLLRKKPGDFHEIFPCRKRISPSKCWFFHRKNSRNIEGKNWIYHTLPSNGKGSNILSCRI